MEPHWNPGDLPPGTPRNPEPEHADGNAHPPQELTAEAVERLPIEPARYEVADADLPGLRVRVTPNGVNLGPCSTAPQRASAPATPSAK